MTKKVYIYLRDTRQTNSGVFCIRVGSETAVRGDTSFRISVRSCISAKRRCWRIYGASGLTGSHKKRDEALKGGLIEALQTAVTERLGGYARKNSWVKINPALAMVPHKRAHTPLHRDLLRTWLTESMLCANKLLKCPTNDGIWHLFPSLPSLPPHLLWEKMNGLRFWALDKCPNTALSVTLWF